MTFTISCGKVRNNKTNEEEEKIILNHSRERVMVEACMKQIIEWPSEGSPK